MRKKAFQAAFPYTIPIFAGFWFLTLAYGIYMNANGFPYPMLMSLLIYGGSLEFVAVEITKEPKTFRRTVSIPHFLTQRIKALRRERLKYRLTLGDYWQGGEIKIRRKFRRISEVMIPSEDWLVSAAIRFAIISP